MNVCDAYKIEIHDANGTEIRIVVGDSLQVGEDYIIISNAGKPVHYCPRINIVKIDKTSADSISGIEV